MTKLTFLFNQLRISLEKANEGKDLNAIRQINERVAKLAGIDDALFSADELIAKQALRDAHTKVLKSLEVDVEKMQSVLNNFEHNKDGLSAYHSTNLSMTF